MKVLFLLVDCLRQDYLGCCGNSRVHTPTVDALAAQGTRFEQAIATATWTPPSVSAIVSGIYPHKLGIYSFDRPFDGQTKTLFHYFEEHGYTVASFVFDEKYLFSKAEVAHVVGNFRDFRKPLRWIEEHSDHNFFLYIHYYWVHGPYRPQNSAQAWSEANARIRTMLREDPEGAEKCKRLYEAAIEKMSEEWLAQILDKLDALSLAEETLIVFTADHGESWGERLADKSQITANFDMHGRFLYDELLRVPLIFRWPGRVPTGRVIPDQVRNIDIMPTILELISIPVTNRQEGYRPMDGVSLVPMMEGRWPGEPLMAISAAASLKTKSLNSLAFRQPPWKLIWTVGEDIKELYHLDRDPSEQVNLYHGEPQVAKALETISLNEYRQAPGGDLTLEEERLIEERLRTLGYV